MSASSRIGHLQDSSVFKSGTSQLPLAMTPGNFFNMRQRNNTSNGRNQTGMMSKTFENFLKAKDRQEMKAKEKIDKLNTEAIKKVKYETLAKRT